MMRQRAGRVVAQIVGRGGIVVFVIMALEVMIMISPFAFFFYSVFNPIFKWVDQFAATRWLTSFFLPHMVLPPTVFLKVIRVIGSLLFVIGLLTFAVCALQVYAGKILRRGVAHAALYRYIRHPQYLALGMWGVGMSILWPRFMVLASLTLMFLLYYYLAKEEERRMVSQYGEAYKQYLGRTGMFLPRGLETLISRLTPRIPSRVVRYAAVYAAIVVAVIGSGFLLRWVTLNSLALASKDNITLLAMLPEDNKLGASVLDGLAKAEAAGRMDCLEAGKDYLAYLMSPDYVMQGMIANTGEEFHLYKQHHTVMMITEWVLHPFQHLRASPSLHMAKMHHVDPAVARRHHCPLGINNPELDCSSCPYRRVIIVEIRHEGSEHVSGTQLLSFNTSRVPICVVDLNTRTGEVASVQKVDKATAWKDVPTPAI